MFTSFAKSLTWPAKWFWIFRRCSVGIASVLGLGFGAAVAEDIRVAVAANFLTTAEVLAEAFESRTGHQVILASGSTGGLYAQIKHGADYDVLLAADQARPILLEKDGFGVTGSRFTYALGRLSLWSVTRDVVDGPAALQGAMSGHLAIANPDLAPYGAAARQALMHFGAWPRPAGQLVLGQNIGQAAAMVASGNADFGLVATSFLITQPRAGSRWDIPAEAHEPIRQDAVLLSAGSEAAGAFLGFLRTDEGRAVIRSHGYEVPE